MSNISSIHDALYSMLGTLFPSKYELTDGLVLENNTGLDLRDGYGISIESTVKSNRLQACVLSISRNVVISLTKEVFAHHQDKAAFKAAEKTMLEDQYSMLMEMEKNVPLGTLTIQKEYVEDTGIQRLILDVNQDGTKQFLLIQTTFLIEYLENIQ